LAKIAFVNTGRYSSSRGIKAFSDPVHLVAMHNLCKLAGHESRVFQLGAPNPEDSIAAILAYAPSFLGLSFLAPFKCDIELVDALLAPFEGRGIHLFLGGPDVEFDPTFYAHKYGTSAWASCTIVECPGERLFETIASHDFCLADPTVLSQLASLGAQILQQDGVTRIKGLPPMPLELQDHTRDYAFSVFQHKACVKWATGCWAACSFCPNIPAKSVYKDPALVAQEVRYLRDLGVQRLDIASPQFTAHPARASALIEALPLDTMPIFFSSRVDSLYHAITRFPDIWQRYAYSNRHGIGLGVDSFLPKKLLRLHKYHTLQQADAQQQRLDAVLSFFADTRLSIVFYMITFDWEMDLAEVQQELLALMECLNRYSSIIQISPENVTNTLSASPGSPLARQRKPLDFFRFERDPRLFLLLYSMYAMHEQMEEIIETSQESHDLMEAAAARLIVKLGLQLISLLEPISPEQADFSRSFAILGETLGDIFQEGPSAYRSNRVQQQLLAIYPLKSQRKIRASLDAIEHKMPSALLREFDVLLSRKAIHRMKINGKIDEKTMRKQLQKYT